MTDYAIWKPEHDGHAPPNWREGMAWAGNLNCQGRPRWRRGFGYCVPAEALNSPNDDAEERMRDYAIKTLLQEGEDALKGLVRELREYPAEELAKHGITLAPEKDVFVELWAEMKRLYLSTYSTDHILANLLHARAMPKGSTDD